MVQLPCIATLFVASDYYKDRSSKLGPDPLREDADPERLWDKMKVSKKPVGGILMDQTAVAGIGNIYRAEILFKVSIKPSKKLIDFIRTSTTDGSKVHVSVHVDIPQAWHKQITMHFLQHIPATCSGSHTLLSSETDMLKQARQCVLL